MSPLPGVRDLIQSDTLLPSSDIDKQLDLSRQAGVPTEFTEVVRCWNSASRHFWGLFTRH